MRKLLYLATCVCLASTLAWGGSSTITPTPNPDDGKVTDRILTNTYFNLSYPLPQGWTEGMSGPGPSVSGYYFLATFVPMGEFTGTITVAAQDILFAARPLDDLMAMAAEFTRSISLVDGMTIDRPPVEVRIAGRVFSRVDFSGVGLFRSALTTKIRCHFVSFNLTAKSPELLADLLRSLDNLGPAGDKDAGRMDPMCVGNYADAEHLLTKVDPAAVAPSFIPIPVRMVVDSSGGVQHVHVIRATSAQRDSIERALGQWKLKPHEVDGRTNEVETGLLIKFTPAGGVIYSTPSRPTWCATCPTGRSSLP
jgi:hypothetical protein